VRRQLPLSAQLMQLGALLLATFVLLAGIATFWRVELSTPKLLLIASVATGFGWLAWRQGWLALLLLLLPPGLVPLLAKIPRAPVWLVTYHQTLQREVAAFIMEVRNLGPEAGFGLTLGQLFVVLIGLCFAAAAAREALGRGRAFLTLLIGSAIFGSQWAFYWEPAAGYGAAFAAVALLLWVLAGSGQRAAVWAESGRKVHYQSPLTAPVASVLLIALGARILPIDFLPATWDAFASLSDTLPILQQMRGNKGDQTEFGLLSTGFSPNGSTLGGPVKPNDDPALEIRLAERLNETLYLRGAVYEQFTGSAWRQAPEAHGSFAPSDSVPSYLHPDAFRREQEIKVTQLQPFGRSLFSPLEAYQLSGLEWEVDGTQMLHATKTVKRNAEYTVTVKQPDWSAEQIRFFERQALGLPIPSELLADVHLSPIASPVTPPGVSPVGSSLENPTFFPGAITRPIQALTQEILDQAKAETPYEKAIALETWLRQAFPYDLNAPAPRPGQNFVEFFLFQAQRGYCTYFASAMTLMLQGAGVQARLVEGFALPGSTTLTSGRDRTAAYVVTNAMAHAWVEAWIPGYGWVTFDPTPRDDIPVTDRSRPLFAPAVGTGGTTTPSTDPTESGDDPRLGPRNQEDEGDLGSLGGTGTAGAQGPNWSLITLLLGLIALVVLSLLRLQLQVPRPSRAGRSGVTEAWSKAEDLLHRFGWGRRSSQTPQEWAAQVGERVRDLQEPLQVAAADYTLARWGPPGTELDPGAPARTTALWQLASQAMRERYGSLRYLWRRLGRAPKRK
jgi:hypothetical protein